MYRNAARTPLAFQQVLRESCAQRFKPDVLHGSAGNPRPASADVSSHDTYLVIRALLSEGCHVTTEGSALAWHVLGDCYSIHSLDKVPYAIQVLFDKAPLGCHFYCLLGPCRYGMHQLPILKTDEPLNVLIVLVLQEAHELNLDAPAVVLPVQRVKKSQHKRAHEIGQVICSRFLCACCRHSCIAESLKERGREVLRRHAL